jgi:hypothetical protein
MFCKICENFMDITNNVSIPNKDDDTEMDTEAESSDYDVTSSSKKTKKSSFTVLNEDILEKVLKGDILEIEIDEKDLNEINKISYFNKLTSNQKTLLINRLYEKIPKIQKIPKEISSNVKLSYFYCKNCGYNEKIPNKMLIFNRSNEKSSIDNFNTNFLNYKYDPLLPRTKKYNCNNVDCITHKHPEKKKALFFRLGNTYVIKYICLECDSFWQTFNNKSS